MLVCPDAGAALALFVWMLIFDVYNSCGSTKHGCFSRFLSEHSACVAHDHLHASVVNPCIYCACREVTRAQVHLLCICLSLWP
jgi:hypothetical protein